MKYILFICLSILFCLGCYKEDVLIASEGDELPFQFPQGGEAVDLEILRLHEQYGTYILYQFMPRDLYWNNTSWIGGEGDDAGSYSENLLCKTGEKAYVPQELNLLKQLLFQNYPEDCLSHLPLKIYLCSSLDKRLIQAEWSPEGMPILVYDTISKSSFKGFDYLALNYCSSSMDTLGMEAKKTLLKDLNASFLIYLFEQNFLDIPTEFIALGNYNVEGYPGGSDWFKMGLLNGKIIVDSKLKTQKNDFISYLSLVTYETLYLNQTSPDYYDWYYPSFQGIFNANIDKEGLVRKKYDIVVNYLNQRNIQVVNFQNPKL